MSDTQGLIPEGTGNEPSGQVSDQNSLIDDFLKDIPDADKEVVKQYVSGWDSKVNGRFEKIHDEYKPYKELGSVDDIKAMKAALDYLDSDPEGALKFIAKELTEKRGADIAAILGLQAPTQPSQPSPQNSPQGGGGLFSGNTGQAPTPQGFADQYPEVDKLLKQLSSVVLKQDEQTKQAEQQRQLDEWLAQKRQEHGDFDTDWVLVHLQRGEKEADVFAKWKELTGQTVRTPAPPALTGGGIQGAQKSIQDMDNKDVKALIAASLAAANQGDNS